MSRIVTFYSYKGGVGRTFALANMAVLLAKHGQRVLMMDWDLEAPGLDRYFRPYLNAESEAVQPPGVVPPPQRGVIQLLHEACADPTADWRAHVQTLTVTASNTNPPASYSISLLTSGVDADDYAEKVRSFSWRQFIEQKQGGVILERWRQEWKQTFDFILLDSRTGITDIGGICTILLPDFLVLVFSANEQSLENSVKIVLSAQAQRRGLDVPRLPLTVLPLLSRFDSRDELELSSRWLDSIAKTMAPLYADWLPARFQPRQILERSKIPYITRFSFGEPLAVLDYSLVDPDLPGFYLDNAARLLLSDFGDAALIIDPAAKKPLDAAAQVRELIALAPIDELELHRLLQLAEQELDSGAELAGLLGEIAETLRQQARFALAEPFFRRALTIDEQSFGPQHPNVALRLNNLAQLLKATNRLAEAEPLMRRALTIDEHSFGLRHPDVARDLNNLAQLLQATNRLAEAEPLMRRVVDICEQSYGAEHPQVAVALNNLAMLLQATNRLTEAEPLLRRVVDIWEQSYGAAHPQVATALNNLAQLLQATNRLAEAEPLMRRALTIDEQSFGPQHPNVAIRLNNLAQLLQATNRRVEAEPLLRRVVDIFEHSYGAEHPQVAIGLNNLAQWLQATNRLAEAEPLMRRVVDILEQSYGAEHPQVAVALNNLAQLLQTTNRLTEAEPLLRRALAIDEQSFGSQHPDVARDLNNLAQWLQATNRLAEAEPLMRRALVIFLQFTRATGHPHPHLQSVRSNYAVLLEKLSLDPAQISRRLEQVQAEAGLTGGE